MRPLCNNSTQQPNLGQGQVQGQGKKNVSFDLQNANFMMEQDPEVLRAQYNLPRDAPISTHYIGESSQSDIANAFSSSKSPQPLKAVIQCVSEVELKLKNNETMYTSCLLDTGSVLNFVSRALMDKMGRKSIYC